MQRTRLLPALFALCLFPACQGIDWSDDDSGDDDTDSAEPTVTEDALHVDLSSGPVCFRFADAAVVRIDAPSDSTAWDMKLEGSSLNLNGGESGPGEAWGLGPVGYGEEEYDAITDHDDVVGPVKFYDSFESVMTDWYVYSAQKLYSKDHVYAIQVPEGGTYKVQLLSYYKDVNGSPESGWITARWNTIDGTAEDSPTDTIDATAGGSHASEDDPDNKYTYLSLSSFSVVDLTDEEASSSTDWDIAFKRYNVKLNGGVSGPKGVMGYDFQGELEETADDVEAYTDAYAQSLFDAASASGLSGATWVSDKIGSIIQGSYTAGGDGTLAPSGIVYVVVDASGDAYYKFLVTGLELDVDGTPISVDFRLARLD